MSKVFFTALAQGPRCLDPPNSRLQKNCIFDLKMSIFKALEAGQNFNIFSHFQLESKAHVLSLNPYS
jgi:hypothetical protein